MFVEDAILQGFFITIVSEAIAVILLVKGQKIWTKISMVCLIHFLTHPLASFLFYILAFPWIIVELIVTIIEGIWYKQMFKISLKNSLLISLAANVASIVIGFIVRSIFL